MWLYTDSTVMVFCTKNDDISVHLWHIGDLCSVIVETEKRASWFCAALP